MSDTAMAIDRGSHVPLHAQVEDLLRRLINEPRYAAGDLLPEEVDLARRLAVSRGTVRAAIARLVDEGLIERRRGVGSRRRIAPQHSGLADWQSFRSEMAARGITVEDFEVDYRRSRAGAEAGRALGVAPDTRVWRLERLRGWEGEPVVLMTSWFAPRLGLDGKEDFSEGLYRVLEGECGVRAQRSEERITAECAGERRAERFGVAATTPLLLRRRLVLDAGGRPLEYAVNAYVSERCAYTLELERRS